MPRQRTGWRYSNVRCWSRRDSRRPPLNSVATTSPLDDRDALARLRRRSADGSRRPRRALRSCARSQRRSRARGHVRSTRQSASSSVTATSSAGQFIEPDPLVVHQRGLASQDRHDVATGDVVQHRHQFVANTIASKGRIVVGLIVQWRRTASTPTKSCSAARRRSRSGFVGSSTIGDRPSSTGAAQHVQQHRLGEVVHRVTREDAGGHRGARAPTARATQNSPPASTTTS